MASYVQKNVTEGSQWGPFYRSRVLNILTPNVRAERRNMPYSNSQWKWLGGDMGPYGCPSGVTFWGELRPSPSDWYDAENTVYARAYAKFKDKVYTQASGLTAIAERAKTIDMVAARLAQLHKGASALRRGRFREFLGTFGIRPRKKHENKRWSRPREFAGLWLEYWMGWAPTVGDVYTSLKFLGQEIPSTKVRAGAGGQTFTGAYTQRQGGATAYTEFRGEVACHIQAYVKLTNPTLYNLQGLGLLNPLKTLWETTPFSWFIDWFTNVGQVLGQLTDWVGLQLEDCIRSTKVEGVHSWVCDGAPEIFGSGFPHRLFRSLEFLEFDREILSTLPVVRPIVRLPNGLSITRAATLASLLVQLFAPNRASN